MAPAIKKNRGGGQGHVRRNVGGRMVRCWMHEPDTLRRCQRRVFLIPTDAYDAVYVACEVGRCTFDPPRVGKIPPGSPTPLPPREG